MILTAKLCCHKKKNLDNTTGFDIVTTENTYFMNHQECTEHKIMGFKPANRWQIIWQSHLSTISIIIHFFAKQKVCKHYLLQSQTLQIAKMR